MTAAGPKAEELPLPSLSRATSFRHTPVSHFARCTGGGTEALRVSTYAFTARSNSASTAPSRLDSSPLEM